ncbi:MAG: ABC transporter ATP-binding protein [Oscillospiraceae bacterium]|nr:ABC transporter ATP-binding protein [Oscillospiraceae bacterium]
MNQKTDKAVVYKLIKYISIYKFKIILALLFGLFSVVINIATPKFLALIIDEFYRALVDGSGANLINIKYIINIIILIIVLYLVGNVILYFQGYLMSKVSVELTYKIRKEMNQKLNKLPVSYFDKVSNGDILSRFINDVEAMTSTLSRVLVQFFSSIITILGTLIAMFLISWRCATIVLVIILLDYIAMNFIVKRSQKFFKAQQNLIGDLNSCVEEFFSQHSIVKAFNAEKKSIELFEDINSRLYKSSWRASFFSTILTPIVFFLGNINCMLVISISCILTIRGSMSIGNVSAFINYVKNLNQPVLQMSNITSVFQKILAATQRVFDFLETKEEQQEKNIIKLPKEINGNIRFENVCFGYEKNKDIIKNISFEVKAGQKVAFVGATGSGKTTIIKLLMRFYEVNKGCIYLDEIDISRLSKDNLRQFFSMVLQDSWIFSGSIAENIRYGNSSASDEEIKKAAQLAYVDHYIQTFPDGYNTVLLNDGENVSQGEKQLLMIARAMITDPKILILDEATSSVDTKTERKIQRALDNLMKDRTSFIIAHRLSTIKNADIIFVMDDGQILESGSHEELLKKSGIYATLYNSQYKI